MGDCFVSAIPYVEGELESLAVPAGRLLYAPEPVSEPRSAQHWTWELHLTDHLGNLRLAVRVPPPAVGDVFDSFEEEEPPQQRTTGSGVPLVGVQNVAGVRAHAPSLARTGAYVAALGGAGTAGAQARQVGPTLRRAVGAGDSVRVEVWGTYGALPRPGLRGAALAAGPETAGEGVGKAARLRWRPRVGVNLLALLAGRATNPVPEAYLWVGLYGKDSVLVDERRVALTDSLPAGEWQQLLAKLYADSAGYVEVALRDESPQAAYFDDLLVRVIKANGIQEHHYDPWGLSLAGIGTRPLDRLERRQFNGKPHSEDFGLHWNFHDARTLDLQIPRWWQVDPLADVEGQESLSSYHFSYNNPVRYSDPDGRCPTCLVGAVVGGVVDYGFQVAGNLVKGKSAGEAFTQVNYTSIGVSILAGAATGGLSALETSAVRMGMMGVARETFAAGGKKMASEAVVMVGESVAKQKFATESGEVTLVKTATDVVAGVAAGALPTKMGGVATKGFDNAAERAARVVGAGARMGRMQAAKEASRMARSAHVLNNAVNVYNGLVSGNLTNSAQLVGDAQYPAPATAQPTLGPLRQIAPADNTQVVR